MAEHVYKNNDTWSVEQGSIAPRLDYNKKPKYIIKNCPSCIISPSCCAKYHIDNGHAKDCRDITDCVIKQVIEKCKLFQNNYLVNDGVQILTTNILNSFDIEEINK